MILYLNIFIVIATLVVLVVLRQKLNKLSKSLWKQSVILMSSLALICVINVLSVGFFSNSKNISNRDVIFVLDLTQSMNAIDGRNGGENTRLENAKDDIKKIVKENPGASYGVFTFSHTTKLSMPLTTNSTDIEDAIDTTFTQSSLTKIPGVIKYADIFSNLGDYLEKQHQLDPTRERIVIMLSDFEVYRNQDNQDEVLSKYNELKQYAGGFINIVYGKDEGAKILMVTYNYETGKYEPSYKVLEFTDGPTYIQDRKNNWQDVVSKPNNELAVNLAKANNGSSLRYTEMDKFDGALKKASKSADHKASTNPKSQSVKQNWIYAPIALILFIWLVLSELLRPKWLGDLLTKSRSQK